MINMSMPHDVIDSTHERKVTPKQKSTSTTNSPTHPNIAKAANARRLRKMNRTNAFGGGSSSSSSASTSSLRKYQAPSRKMTAKAIPLQVALQSRAASTDTAFADTAIAM